MKISKSGVISLMVVFLAFVTFSTQAAAGNDGPAKKGDMVTVEYTGTFPDGTVFDSSDQHKTPLKFKVGSGQVIKGFDDAVTGMKIGENKSFTLKPAEAYGDVNPKLVQKVPRKELPKGQEPKVGMRLLVGSPDGRHRPAVITEVHPDHIMLDMNHPLAGKTLTFKIKLTAITP